VNRSGNGSVFVGGVSCCPMVSQLAGARNSFTEGRGLVTKERLNLLVAPLHLIVMATEMILVSISIAKILYLAPIDQPGRIIF
jgi:hypothetical protein